MGISEIIGLLSGVALFLYGMSLMGEGLKQVSGNKLAPILFKLSSTQVKGVLFGTGVTAVIQSSCATAVMTVGFVNSGMMKLRQAVAVILGAILGTSVTGWVICLGYLEGADGIASLLSTATLTGIVALIGMLLRMFGKKRSTIQIGNICMGFSILMFGMSTMSGSVSALGDAPWFRALLTQMSHPALGILGGIVITALLQSASAAVGILQALSVTGAMTLEAAVPLFLGVTIGASAPVLLSALGANVSGKRTAMVYLVASFMGAMAVAALFYILDGILEFGFLNTVMNPFLMAEVNSLLRLAIVLLLMPFTDVIEMIVTLMVPDKKKEGEKEIQLEERFIAHPALAIAQCRLVIGDMARLAEKAVLAADDLIWHYSDEGFARVQHMEEEADRYEDVLGTYLAKLTGRPLAEQQSREVSKFLHVLTDFERLTDHALNIAGSAQERHEKRVSFSEKAQQELRVLTSAVAEAVQLTVQAFTTGDLAEAHRIEPLESVIDELCDQMKLNHVERLQQQDCTIMNGFIFNDLLTNFERVGDHCSNVAVAMIELDIGRFDTHEYLDKLKEKQTRDFTEMVAEFRSRYALQ